MLIQKQVFLDFKRICKVFFKNNREGMSADLVKELLENHRSLYKTIEKAVGKQKVMNDYVGRLLRNIAKEGWLIYEKKRWKVKPKWGYCTYCFAPLDEIYLIDIDHHQYCNSNCFDEMEAILHYDSYADEYMFLFWEFEKLKGKYRFYLDRQFKKDIPNHLDITMIIRDVYDLLNEDENSEVLLNGGDDGPLAGEMYRMLMILKKDAEVLEKLLGECEKVLPHTNERFSIEISNEIMRKKKRPESIKEFIKANRKFRDKENKNKWTTGNSSQQLNWHITLTEEEELKNHVTLLNEVECPQCKKIEDKKLCRRVPTGYYYCEECYEELDFEYGFKR